MSSFDAAVIGSGPAGVPAAMYLVRSGCSIILFEKMAAGGQILQTEALENYPGYPKGIKGYELADLFAAHLEGLPVTHSRDAVESVSGEAGNFVVQAGGKEHSCRTVIVCSGAHHRELGLADEKRLQGRGVPYSTATSAAMRRSPSSAAAMLRWRNPFIWPSWLPKSI